MKLADNVSFQIDEFYLDLQQNGSSLRNLSEEEILNNPFPGLRPFKTSEQDLFYGRKEQTNELILKLAATNFLAVIGSSGTGKSSLVRAGLIPALFGGNITNKGTDWKIAICRPGNDPIKNLSIALSSTKSSSSNKEKILEENNIIEPLLRASSYGILDVKELMNEENTGSTQQNLLVIIDQFEELFRFDRKELKAQNILYQNIESDFVKLLLQCKSDIKSIFVVITMRSEFLGECVKFRGLPEAINRSQYLVPQLEREQLKKVITGPVQRAGKGISADLVEILINEIESEKLKENLDQLPILQHALMRTYDVAFKKSSGNKEMLYEHYKETGGMKEALARHAQEVFDELANNDTASASKKNNANDLSRKQLIAKTVFQALTDATSDQKGGRRPTELQNIYDILTTPAINASHAEIDEIINCFRNEETSFIMPPSNTRLHPGLMLDISHESLMRNWHDLKKYWIKEETTAADLYIRLNDNREQYERDNETFVGGVLLRDLLQWRDSGLYNNAWAERYQKIPADIINNPNQKNKTNKQIKHELYSKNLEYLKKCLKQSAKEIEEEIKRQKEKVKKNRLIAVLSILVAVTAISLGLYASVQSKKFNSERLKSANTETKRKIDSTNAIAETKRKIDLINAQAAAQRKIALINAQAAAQKKIDKASAQSKIDKANAALAAAKTDSIMNASNSVFNRLHEILELVNEPFYKSDLFDSATKNMYVDTLVKYRYKLNDNAAFQNQLNNLNKAVDIYNTAQNNPNKALLEAATFNQAIKNKLSEHMLIYVANNCGFSGKNILLSKAGYDYYNQPLPVISRKRKFLAAVTNDSINIYKIINDELLLIKSVPLQTDMLSAKDSKVYSDVHGPGTITFTNQNTVIAFLNNMIYKIDLNDLSQTTEQIPNITQDNVYERFYASSISPNGKKLAIDYRNYNIKVWDIDTINKSPQLIKLDSLRGYIYNIKFSADAEKIIIQQRDKFIVKSLKTNVDNPPYEHIDLAGDSTADNKYIIVHIHGVFELYDINNLNKTPISTLNFSEINIDTFKNATVSAMKLSSDWKTFVIKASSEKNYSYSINTYYFQRNDKDSVFRFNRELNTKNFGRLVKMPYLNSSATIVVNDNGIAATKTGYDEDTVNFWKVYDTVSTTTQLHYLVHVISSSTDTTEEKDDFKNIDSINDIEYLKRGLKTASKKDSRIFTKESLYDVKNFCRRLSELDTATYFNRYRTVSGNYYNYYSDTIERIKDLKKITATEEILMKHDSLDLLNAGLSIDSIKKNLSFDYWNLSWYLLLNNKLDSVVYMTATGIRLDSINDGIITNLALGYLLTEQCEEADSIYKRFKGKTYKKDNRKFTASFLQDLSDLENLGIITPDKKEIYQHVQKIRQYLKDETNTLDCKN